MITTLDPRTALVVIDLQQGITERETAPHAAADVVARSATLATAFRAASLPVVLVTVTAGAPGRTDLNPGGGGRELDAVLAPELDPQPGDKLVVKRSWGAFHGTDLGPWLAEQDVTQIVLTGIATSIGVETTARAAYEHGLNVTLATDAMADMSGANHDHAVSAIFPRLGETGTTAEILAALAG